MADTFTTNLTLTKPEVGASEDTWGTKLNANSDALDNLFQSGPALKVASGGTGATTAAQARTNLGLGSMALQDTDSVVIDGGSATLSSVVVSAAMPILNLRETGVATGTGGWQFRADGGAFAFYALDDGNAPTSTALSVSRSGTAITAVNVYPTLTVNGYPAYHAGNISSASIQESQLVDANVFPRIASTETVTGQWNFTTVPQKTSGGKFLHYASSSYVGGAVTVSTGTPTGIPATGDRWVQYVP